jgi:hypothetical protein
MITSRGCPYKCTFCKLAFQKTLSRSANDVLNEMEKIAELGIREVEVYDDTFTWSKKRLIDICKGIVERGIDLDWAIRDRVSSATPDAMEWLAKAGCRRIHFGVESGSNKTLETIKKAINTDQAIEAVRLAKSHGIQVLAYFMLGLPARRSKTCARRFSSPSAGSHATFSVTSVRRNRNLHRRPREKSDSVRLLARVREEPDAELRRAVLLGRTPEQRAAAQDSRRGDTQLLLPAEVRAQAAAAVVEHEAYDPRDVALQRVDQEVHLQAAHRRDVERIEFGRAARIALGDLDRFVSKSRPKAPISVSRLRAAISSDVDALRSIYSGRGCRRQRLHTRRIRRASQNFSRFLEPFSVKATLFMVG